MPKTQIMGILNCTPDSFSGDGLINETAQVKNALLRARSFIQDGADILDIGGESTRPGSTPIDAEEELQRVIPVIQAIHSEFPHIPLSCDTTKRKVAEKSVESGACMINDISALRADSSMASFLRSAGISVILMHNCAQFGHQVDPRYGAHYLAGTGEGSVVERVERELTLSLEGACREGIKEENILLDPGIGFGKSAAENCTLLKETSRLKNLGRPLVIGPSRKSFIGHILECKVEDRLEGTAAAVAIATLAGADIIRVHDVKFMKRFVVMIEAINQLS